MFLQLDFFEESTICSNKAVDFIFGTWQSNALHQIFSRGCRRRI